MTRFALMFRWWLLMRKAEKQFPGLAPKGKPPF